MVSSGEICALALLDTCIRLVVGVVNSKESCINEPFSEIEGVEGVLEYPLWRGVKVPDLFLVNSKRFLIGTTTSYQHNDLGGLI